MQSREVIARGIWQQAMQRGLVTIEFDVAVWSEHALQREDSALRELLNQPVAGGWVDRGFLPNGRMVSVWRPHESSEHWLLAALSVMPQLGFDGLDALVLAGAFANTQQCSWPCDRTDFPRVDYGFLTDRLSTDIPTTSEASIPMFARCFLPNETAALGFYPVVDSVPLLRQLLALGVTTLQLRIKQPALSLENTITEAVALGRQYRARLFINDHWQLAIAAGAYGVHLGQEDLLQADLVAIAQAGLHLGISTHGYYELLCAAHWQPSYIALGHIFPTTTKQMPSLPQGVARLATYQQLVCDYPTVAIGGIDLGNAAEVLATGVGSVAVVRAVTQASDLPMTVAGWQQLCATLQPERDAVQKPEVAHVNR